MFDISGKNAIVTGAAIGIGRSYSEHLLKYGANVCISDINEETGMATVKEFQERFGKDRVMFAKCDVSNADDLKSLWADAEAKLGYISILVNNAGLFARNQLKKSLDIMCYGVGYGTELACEKMSFKNGGKGGRIITTASYAGLSGFPYVPEGLGYAMSKWGVVGMTRSFGRSDPDIFTQAGIKAFAVCPFFADTKLVNDSSNLQELEERYKTRLLTADEVGRSIIDIMEKDKNGSVWGVFPDCPILEFPNLTMHLHLIYVILYKLLNKAGINIGPINPYLALLAFAFLAYIALSILCCVLGIIF